MFIGTHKHKHTYVGIILLYILDYVCNCAYVYIYQNLTIQVSSNISIPTNNHHHQVFTLQLYNMYEFVFSNSLYMTTQLGEWEPMGNYIIGITTKHHMDLQKIL